MGFGTRVFPIALTVVLAVCSAPASAAEATDGAITIPTVATAPALVADLSSPVWQQAATVTLDYDRQTHARSSESTKAYILTDGKALWVGFDAHQTRTAILANQRTNNVGVDTDDEVKIALWPGGRSGFNYQFVSTPIGT